MSQVPFSIGSDLKLLTTCYRGLWTVDGSFLMEAVAMLGRTEEARAGIRYLLSFQRPDGAIMLIDKHYKETGIEWHLNFCNCFVVHGL
jgi:GH15 family glucan-1,4-alpha-glucosidase